VPARSACFRQQTQAELDGIADSRAHEAGSVLGGEQFRRGILQHQFDGGMIMKSVDNLGPARRQRASTPNAVFRAKAQQIDGARRAACIDSNCARSLAIIERLQSSTNRTSAPCCDWTSSRAPRQKIQQIG
jgi:hypothetical protein